MPQRVRNPRHNDDVTSVEREPTSVRPDPNVRAKTVKLPHAVPGRNLPIPNSWRSPLITNPAKGKVSRNAWIDRRAILRRNGSYVVPPLRNFPADFTSASVTKGGEGQGKPQLDCVDGDDEVVFI